MAWIDGCCTGAQALLGDSNPMVVANAVAALAELAEVSGRDVLQITRESIKKLLRALNECTEWGQVSRQPLCSVLPAGHVHCSEHLQLRVNYWLELAFLRQVFILDAISEYDAHDAKEAEETIERVTPRLQHANCAVVLSAVKVREIPFSFCLGWLPSPCAPCVEYNQLPARVLKPLATSQWYTRAVAD